MTIQVDNALPPNVVEIGNEITQGVVDGLMSSSPSASSSNPYVTVNGVSGVYLPLAGGTMTGDIGVNYNDLNQVTSIVFADSTVQTTAPVNAATWGSITGTLSSQTDLQNALNTKLTASSNLSDLANAGTARTNLGVAYATDAQAIAGTSASTVMSPSNSLWQAMSPSFYSFANINTSSSINLGGGALASDTWGARAVSGTNSGGYGVIRSGAGTTFPITTGISPANINWSKVIILSQLVSLSGNTSNYRGGFGVTAGHINTDLNTKSIGYRVLTTGALELQVHDGTTLTTVSSSFTPSAGIGFDLLIHSNGLGTATMYVNNSLVATTTGAPTGGGSNNINFWFCGIDNPASIAVQNFHYTGNRKLFIGR